MKNKIYTALVTARIQWACFEYKKPVYAALAFIVIIGLIPTGR